MTMFYHARFDLFQFLKSNTYQIATYQPEDVVTIDITRCDILYISGIILLKVPNTKT